jgi:hypothetical protein
MKLVRLVTVGVILPFLLALCVVTTGVATSGGMLVATDALEIREGEDAYVLIFLNGSYDPVVRGVSFCVNYDESIADCIKIAGNTAAGQGSPPNERHLLHRG